MSYQRPRGDGGQGTSGRLAKVTIRLCSRWGDGAGFTLRHRQSVSSSRIVSVIPREAPFSWRYTALSPPRNSPRHRNHCYQARPPSLPLSATTAAQPGTVRDGSSPVPVRTSRSRSRPRDTVKSGMDTAASQSCRKTQSSASAHGSSSTLYHPVSAASLYHSTRPYGSNPAQDLLAERACPNIRDLMPRPHPRPPSGSSVPLGCARFLGQRPKAPSPHADTLSMR